MDLKFAALDFCPVRCQLASSDTFVWFPQLTLLKYTEPEREDGQKEKVNIFTHTKNTPK